MRPVDEWPAIAGTWAEVAAVTRTFTAAQIAHMTDPEPIPGAPGRVMVRYLPSPNPQPVRPRPAARPAGRVTRTERTGLALLGGLSVGLGVGVAVGWSVHAVLLWAAHHVALLSGVLLALLVAWWAMGKAGACPGVHCPGCRHR